MNNCLQYRTTKFGGISRILRYCYTYLTLEEDASFTLALDQLELYANSNSLEAATLELIQDLKVYAQDYIERSQFFLQAPNRKSHFPYVLRVLLCENDEEIRGLLEFNDAS